MNNFQYYTPTKVVFGRGAEEETGNLIQAYGCTKVLVHYGSGSVKVDRTAGTDLPVSREGWDRIYYAGRRRNPTHTYPLYMKGSNCAKRRGLTLFWP